MLASEIVLNSFSRNNLLSSNHRFRQGDSCINQLLSINKDILSVFDGFLTFSGEEDIKWGHWPEMV